MDRSGKKDAAGTPKALSPGEVRRLLDTARTVAPEFRPLFATLFMAGLRPGEALAVTPDRVDLAAKAITVDRQLSTHTGLTTTKTGGSRKVDLSDALAGILAAAFTPRQHTQKVVSIAPGIEEPLMAFVPPWPLAPGVSATPMAKEIAAAYRSALRAFSRCLEKSGISRASTATVGRADGFGLHTGRHSFATALISAACPQPTCSSSCATPTCP